MKDAHSRYRTLQVWEVELTHGHFQKTRSRQVYLARDFTGEPLTLSLSFIL